MCKLWMIYENRKHYSSDDDGDDDNDDHDDDDDDADDDADDDDDDDDSGGGDDDPHHLGGDDVGDGNARTHVAITMTTMVWPLQLSSTVSTRNLMRTKPQILQAGSLTGTILLCFTGAVKQASWTSLGPCWKTWQARHIRYISRVS